MSKHTDLELLEMVLDWIDDCKSQWPDDWDEVNQRCIPESKYECSRCYTKRKIEERLAEGDQ